MASGSAGSIFVDLLLRDAQYRAGMKGAKSATSDFAKGVKDLARELAPLVGGAGLTAIATSALKAAEAINDSSKAIGLSAEEFQKYSFALKQGGIDQEGFTTALTKLNNNIAAGNLPYKTTAEALLAISERLKNAKDGIERARIASEAFGSKLGAKMIPALIGGREEVLRLAKEAEALGLVFSDQLTQDADDFMDEIGKLGDVVTKNFQAGLLAEFVGQSGDIRDIYTDPSFIKGVQDIGEAFGTLVSFVIDSVKAFQDAKKALAAFGIEVGARSGWIDRDVADEALLEAGERMRASADPARSTRPGGGGNPPEIDLKKLKERQEAIEAVYDSLTKQTVLIQLQNDNFGESKEKIEGILRAREVMFDLEQKGVVLSDKERANIQAKLDALQTEKELQAELKEAEEARVEAEKERLKLQEEQRKRFEDSIQDIKKDLAGEITQAIKGAQSLGDAFKNVAAKIAEAVTQAQILKLLSSAGLGGGSGGGGGMGWLGDLLGGLLSFDVGTPYVPRDQIAQIHQGEMIIPRVQAERIRQGGMGGVTVNQYITTPDAGSFQRSQQQVLAQTQQMLSRATKRNN